MIEFLIPKIDHKRLFELMTLLNWRFDIRMYEVSLSIYVDQDKDLILTKYLNESKIRFVRIEG